MTVDDKVVVFFLKILDGKHSFKRSAIYELQTRASGYQLVDLKRTHS